LWAVVVVQFIALLHVTAQRHEASALQVENIEDILPAANKARPKQQRERAAARPALAARAHLRRRRLALVARGTGKRGPDLRQQPHL
jgi:hypothetical protein